MGLTVSHRFEFRGSKTELIRKLEGLRSRFMDLPTRSVEEVVEIPRASLEFGYAHYEDERHDRSALGSAMLLSYFDASAPERVLGRLVRRVGGMVNADSLPPQERRRFHRLRRVVRDISWRRADRILRFGNGLSLKVGVGDGCERFEVVLGRLGKGRLWRGPCFTKRQYAEHLVPIRAAANQILDFCSEAGILRNIKDESWRWEMLGLEELATNINASTEIMVEAGMKLASREGILWDAGESTPEHADV